jgi:hypothetical protein
VAPRAKFFMILWLRGSYARNFQALIMHIIPIEIDLSLFYYLSALLQNYYSGKHLAKTAGASCLFEYSAMLGNI